MVNGVYHAGSLSPPPRESGHEANPYHAHTIIIVDTMKTFFFGGGGGGGGSLWNSAHKAHP